MPMGTIKFFNDQKGYGFISTERDENIYVHHSSIKKTGYRTLKEGQEVWFVLREGRCGVEAVNVHQI